MKRATAPDPKGNATMKAALTLTDFAALLARGSRIHFDHASIEVKRVPVVGAQGETERRFVMEGRSGVHSLLVDATDLDRLNAHWTTFATHELNRAA
jgi:hypothetical protein